MTKVEIGPDTFVIEFRHVTKLGKRAKLHRGPVTAVTTCAIFAYGASFPRGPLLAIDNSICVEGDQFSRWQGRLRSFYKATHYCRALGPFTDILCKALFNDRAKAPKQAKLTVPQKEALYNSGSEKRRARQLRKAQGGA